MIQVYKNEDEMQFWVGGMYQPELNRYFLQTTNLPMQEIEKNVWKATGLPKEPKTQSVGLRTVKRMIDILDSDRKEKGLNASGYIPVAFKICLPLSGEGKHKTPFSVMYAATEWETIPTEGGKLISKPKELNRIKFFTNGALPKGITTKCCSILVNAAFEQYGIDVEEIAGDEGVLITEEAMKNKTSIRQKKREWINKMMSGPLMQSFASAFDDEEDMNNI